MKNVATDRCITFRRVWVKELRPSEKISAKKCHLNLSTHLSELYHTLPPVNHPHGWACIREHTTYSRNHSPHNISPSSLQISTDDRVPPIIPKYTEYRTTGGKVLQEPNAVDTRWRVSGFDIGFLPRGVSLALVWWAFDTRGSYPYTTTHEPGVWHYHGLQARPSVENVHIFPPVRAILNEATFPHIFQQFFPKQKWKKRKTRKYVHFLEILKRAKLLEGFAFQ